MIKIDQEKCVGCGRCTEICSDIFRLNQEGKAEVISQENVECAKNAADQCPMEAIFVEE